MNYLFLLAMIAFSIYEATGTILEKNALKEYIFNPYLLTFLTLLHQNTAASRLNYYLWFQSSGYSTHIVSPYSVSSWGGDYHQDQLIFVNTLIEITNIC